ncbi:LuxS/MPP-like metallohydrolase [Metschnikowia bicuspidata var. bicuspidata NRRL YB-4993]|uniref:LuxS/MPP-like metallohydrolase n=1 Tax=Metschnikowia bicuspidata var. bicuspidata NRRL YB-4993 TaxID=869754 RepID=A0A1A0H737_9ASCO|nr:LuxS/MPP-like metallohydrolase [Metschnikowia bicuspidata var. bicuspidata NRRL YB-4993]OBA19770.1 LuxS/MPP-like metallohydrolase [Metschnikowia bicuspidata var. bicuspidata NRRL YB-4993]
MGAAAARRLVSTSNSATKYSTLSNGVTVATEHNPLAPSAAIGVFFGAGSRAETPYNNGVAALAASVLGAGLHNGVLLSSLSTRETNAIVAQSTNADVATAAQTLAQIVSQSTEAVSRADLEAAKRAQAARAAAVENSPSQMVLEHLNASAFQGYSLGLPTLGTAESIGDLEKSDVLRLLEKHLVGSNTVVSACGNFEHDALVDALEGSLAVPAGIKPAVAPASFLGSEVRMRDDTNPKAFVSIAAQGEGVNSPAYHVAKVAAAVLGDFDHSAAVAKFTSPKLASIVQEYHIVDKYTHFSNSYSDTGLWGFNAEISNLSQIDDFVHFTLKEWNRLSVSVTDAEVARGKAAAKTALLASLNSPLAIASEVANKVLLQGYKASISQELDAIDAITTKDVKAWASAALWDKDIVIAGTGSIEGLLDYNRCRNDMAMLRI